MRPLSSTDLLRVWELGQHRPAWKRALLLLAAAFPNATQRELASLSIGQRNTYLFALRELTLGPTLMALARCARCRQEIEFSVRVRDLCRLDLERTVEPEYLTRIDGIEVYVRPPTTLDLAAVADSRDVVEARQRLIRRSIRRARRDGNDLAISDMPETVISAVGDFLISSDPSSDIRLGMECPVCQHSGAARFDVASFFWTELSAQVQRVLRDVDLLAHAYGWHEADILAMSPFRRQAYLDLVNG